MEQWIPLRDYDGYSISDQGRVRNDRRMKVLSTTRSMSGCVFVGLFKNKTQYQRGVAKLVAETFVVNTKGEFFNSVIHLDGDLDNCRANNLAWRPRWFAQKFTRQFKIPLIKIGPIQDLETGAEYSSAWVPVREFGLLYMEVFFSTQNGTRVFPTNQRFSQLM